MSFKICWICVVCGENGSIYQRFEELVPRNQAVREFVISGCHVNSLDGSQFLAPDQEVSYFAWFELYKSKKQVFIKDGKT